MFAFTPSLRPFHPRAGPRHALRRRDDRAQGAHAFAARLKAINQGDVRIDILRTVPTVNGFVTEHEERQQVGNEDLTTRSRWLCEVRDGRTVEAVGYCSGEWDALAPPQHDFVL